ncbi:MAG: hypothetical protein U5L11_03520 [Arhodomonas sp.]|nr:hypothetical protein [Arhodomonas sp.]
MQRALDLTGAQRERLAAAARERVVSRYSLKATAARYLAVYRGEQTQNQRDRRESQ